MAAQTELVFISLKVAKENIRDYIRSIEASKDKRIAALELIEECVLWSTFTNYDSVGLLEVAKRHFFNNIEETRKEPFQKYQRTRRKLK